MKVTKYRRGEVFVSGVSIILQCGEWMLSSHSLICRGPVYTTQIEDTNRRKEMGGYEQALEGTRHVSTEVLFNFCDTGFFFSLSKLKVVAVFLAGEGSLLEKEKRT